ncbi:MAG TPA: carboxypeptidase regulatory-like domain-containing protein [Pyrinomonadaceae bacterium]|nr:carboxypeptidase regulatory-like domain-containing protein [Pyrinomonadaceae bacterium]
MQHTTKLRNSILLILFASTLAAAQTFRGTILGTVTDPNGAVVPGAKVTAKNTSTGLERSTTTDEAGNYTLPELPIGPYEVRVEQTGFATAIVSNVTVAVASERRIDVNLNVAAQENLVVIAPSLQAETTVNTLGGTITATAAADLPINGRDFTKFLVMVPGATGDPSGATDSPGSFGLFSANGNRGRANNYLLDGTDMNDGYRNLPAINEAGVFGTPATILPIEAISEAAILSNFEAEYGRNSGAIVNIVTKSGTNEFHGSLFEFFRNNKLDARNVFNPKPDPQTQFRNNQFGGALGGPIVRNRTFFYFAYEGQRERVGLNSTARVPDPQEIAALGGPTNPVIARLLARNPWPAPNRPLPLFDNTGRPNLFVTTPASNDVDSLIAKIDHSFNKDNQLTGRYFYGTSDQSFPLAILAGNILPGYNTVTPTKVHLVSISFLKILSSTKVNEVRFGFNRFKEGFFPQDSDFDPRSIGLNTGITSEQDFGLPQIRIHDDLGIANVGATLSVPRARTDINYQLIDNFSWKLARHDLKFGYEFRRTTVDQFFDAGYRGRLDFASLADFLSGTLSGGRAARGNSSRFTFQNSHAGYLQDTFRWRPDVTLNLGLRWDYFGVIDEKNHLLSNFDPSRGLVQVGSPGLPRLYDRDWNNFSPRLGFAWNVHGNGKTVVRAGWGLFYDAFSQDFFAGQLPFNTFNPGPAFNPVGPSPILFSFSTVDTIQNNVPIFTDFLDSDVFAVDPNLRTPYVQNYNLNIQRELFRNGVFEVGYVGSHGTKLFRYRDINQPVNPSVSSARPFDNGPFAPSGGTFFYVNQLETTAISNYNALQTSFSVRDRHGFSAQANYTWSHSIDNASDGQDYVANATQPDNSYCTKCEKANSNFDNRHRFVVAASYALPNLWESHPRLGKGWQLNTVVTIRSGNPFHLTLFDDYNNTGEFFPRPDLIGDPYAGTHAPDQFINLAAFKVPCTLDPTGDGSAASCIPGTWHFGSLGRNALRGPGYRNVDFSIFKDTNITEKLRIQLRAEVFNIFNHPNFSNPLLPSFAADMTSSIDPVTGRGTGFLPITVTPDVGIGNPFLGGGGPRDIQLAVKFIF